MHLPTRCHAALLILTIPLAAVSRLPAQSHPRAAARIEPFAESAEYQSLQRRLARGWNTWDVNSVTTHVLLPEGRAPVERVWLRVAERVSGLDRAAAERGGAGPWSMLARPGAWLPLTPRWRPAAARPGGLRHIPPRVARPARPRWPESGWDPKPEGTLADQLERIAALHASGALNDAEFAAHAGRSPTAYLAALRYPGSSSLAADPL